MPLTTTPRQKAVWLSLALIGFVLIGIIHSPGVIWGGFRWDESFSEYIPWRVEAARLWRTGEFPLYTPRVFGGMPLFSTSYSGVLYPPNWLYIIFPPTVSAFLEFLHTVLGGTGMYLYLRSRRFLPFVAVVGSLFFISNTFLISHSPHVSMREAALMAPWLAWLARRLLLSPGPGRAALLAAAIAAHIAIGYQQLFLFAVVWIGLEWIDTLRSARRVYTPTAWLLAAGIVGVMLMGVQILPTLGHTESTPRTGMTLDSWQTASFSPSHLIILFSPRFLGYESSFYIGHPPSTELVATIPSGGWALACIAVVWMSIQKKLRKSVRFRTVLLFATALLLTLFLAFGSHFGPNALLFHVPPFNLFRVPSRWLFLTSTFAVILAVHGLQALLAANWWRRLLVYTFGLTAWAAICTGLFLLLRDTPPDDRIASLDFWRQVTTGRIVAPAHMENMMSRIGLPGVGELLDATGIHPLIWLVAAVLIAVPRRHAWLAVIGFTALFALDAKILVKHGIFDPEPLARITNRTDHPLLSRLPDDESIRLYTFSSAGKHPGGLALPGNTFLFQDAGSLSGYCPLLSDRLRFVTGITQNGIGYSDDRMIEKPNALRHLAVTHIFARPDRMNETDRWNFERNLGREYEIVAWHDGFQLLRLADSRPRFDSAARWRPPTREEIDQFIFWFDPSDDDAFAVLEDPKWSLLPPAEETLAPARIEVVDDGGAHIQLRVESKSGAVVLFRDVLWPGWESRIIGNDGYQRVRRANGIIGYIPVPPGKQIVELRFRPPGWGRGLALSWAGLACLVLMLIVPRLGGKTLRPGPKRPSN